MGERHHRKINHTVSSHHVHAQGFFFSKNLNSKNCTELHAFNNHFPPSCLTEAHPTLKKDQGLVMVEEDCNSEL